ncbi:carbohydrate-binding protein [Geofilum rubicundum]|uniref:Glucanase C n=1 Tax=Geofilum rubicundum JCM 15548 TaxID=1236989 RepID=A0A0E9LW94_9BACT|nr:carbohydrate-binding protein [Geofilum rubicundum]GAO29578.1 glucanase C [Geofilum rubicundum JCM 15548]
MKKKNFTLSVGLLIGFFVSAGIGEVQGNPIVIEAKDYENKSGAIVDEVTHLSGIVPWEWVSFNAITIATEGDYLIEYEVASVGGGGVFQLEQGGVGTVFGTATIPATGADDIWQVASHVVTLPAGEVAFGVKGIGDNWNAWGLKSITISEAGAVEEPEFITIEAEDFSGKDGDVTDEGTYLSNIAPWRWISFDNVSIPETGTYLVEYRVACAGGGDYLNLEEGGTPNVHGSIDIPDTGGNDQWEVISHIVELTEGIQNFGIKGMGDAGMHGVSTGSDSRRLTEPYLLLMVPA